MQKMYWKTHDKFKFVLVCLYSYDKTFPGHMKHIHLSTPDRVFKTDQSTDNTKVQHGEPMNFIGVICG